MSTKHYFYRESIEEMTGFIQNSTSFTAIGISDFGRTVMFKQLASQSIADKFIFADVFDLPVFTRVEFFRNVAKQLGSTRVDLQTEEEAVTECVKQLQKLVSKNNKIIVCFNRLDLVDFEFDRTFLHHLRSLWSIDPKKVVFIFGVCSAIHNIAPDAIMGIDVLFYSHIYYLPLFSPTDLQFLAEKYGNTPVDQETYKRALNLSGGHFQLYQLLTKSKFTSINPMDDEFILLCLKNIYKHLNYSQKKSVEKVALGKNVHVDDPYLLQTGMVKNIEGKLSLFSPLFTEFINTHTRIKLSDKENKLFKLLKQHLGKTVSRDQIFETVWADDENGATDWALDALAYRLRKNPSFTKSGYILENYKKIGYALIKQ